jgi:hypothetical protein
MTSTPDPGHLRKDPTMALKRRTVLVTAGATAVLVAGGTTAAFAAGTTPTAAATASTATCAPGVAPLLRAAPRTLTTDLQHLAKDTGAGKARDRAEIRRKALAGAYGVRIERVARIVAGDTGALPATLPASLKADLKTLRSDARGSAARKAEAATIWSKALAGSYGTTIESLAKDAKARVDQRCAAKASTGGS